MPIIKVVPGITEEWLDFLDRETVQPLPCWMPQSTERATMTHFHGFGIRTGADVPLGNLFKPGKFGRMFPNLAPHQATEAALQELGAAMQEEAARVNAPVGDNPAIPAGFTYLGQFIDHDITFDTTPLPEVTVDPLAVHNFRTPRLDLDCLYGSGPVAHPFLYQRADRDKFLIGMTREAPDEKQQPIAPLPNDLPRGAEGFALIGDPRNDENLIVAQLHLALLKFHNQVVERLRAERVPAPRVFSEARRTVTWHYQWMVLHDFLERLVDRDQYRQVQQYGRRFYRLRDEPYIPVEFSVAAYRLGHSMVRQEYDYNRVFNPSPNRLAAATFDFLFQFTGLSGPNTGRFQMPLPSNWIIDWRRFFELPRPASTAPNAPTLNASRRLDPFLIPELHQLPLGPQQEIRLPVRNLVRGLQFQLPPGQRVARAMGFTPLTAREMASVDGPDVAIAQQHGFDTSSPLWYYILKEAQIQGKGRRLGQVGSRILTEVFVGLLEGDSESFLAQAPEWTPTLGGREDFTMVDLLAFVGDINPIGD
jgi:hypothetical protein